MKIALYIEDGLEQIVLTAETDTEKAILSKLRDGTRKMEIHSGAFYACRGGWVRHKQQYLELHGVTDEPREDESTIIVLRQGDRK
jgi:hypothetical protein